MEMAYIMSILKTQLVVVWSWGFHKPIVIENGLQFKVQGFKFRGVLSIVYNEGRDLFDVSFIKANKVVCRKSFKLRRESSEGIFD